MITKFASGLNFEVGRTARPGHVSPPIWLESYRKILALDLVFYLTAYFRRVKKVLFMPSFLYITSCLVQR